jgi:hypothetical protein
MTRPRYKEGISSYPLCSWATPVPLAKRNKATNKRIGGRADNR